MTSNERLYNPQMRYLPPLDAARWYLHPWWPTRADVSVQVEGYDPYDKPVLTTRGTPYARRPQAR